MRHRRTPSAAALTCLVALAFACRKAPPRIYQDPKMDFGSVRTVAVLPFANLSRDMAAGDRLRDAMATALLASNAVYVLPQGEVARGLSSAAVTNPSAPTVDEIVKIGKLLKVDAVITGVVREYGEVRSGTASANVVSLSAQMQETGTGKVVWAASTAKGGVGMSDRLFGSGGAPLNDVTQEAVDDLLDKLFR